MNSSLVLGGANGRLFGFGFEGVGEGVGGGLLGDHFRDAAKIPHWLELGLDLIDSDATLGLFANGLFDHLKVVVVVSEDFD